MIGGAFHGLVEGLAVGRKDGEDGKGQSNPNVRGCCAEALPRNPGDGARAGSGGSKLRLSRWGRPLKEVTCEGGLRQRG